VHQILILPFGILPLILLAAYLVWKVLEATGQRTITDDRRFGTTEFPTEVSKLLCGMNHDELAFSADGKSVILTILDAYCELANSANAQRYIKDNFYGEDDVNRAWADQLTVTHVARTEQPRGYRLTITMPCSTVLSMKYIENEIKNLGRIFTRNASNDHRWLLFPQEARSIEVSKGRMLVRVGRVQLVPTLLGNWKDGVMSERQITRNIKNRLWNRVDVRCISIDRQTYYGEIIFPASH
jgi:hypothetical protein